MKSVCTIQISCNTRPKIKEHSLTFDADGNPTETYDSIIRRAIKTLNTKNVIDVSKL